MFLCRWMRVGRVVAVGALAVLGPACGAEPAVSEQEIELAGTLNVPLTASAGGHTYRFSRFDLLIQPPYVWLSPTGDPNETALSIELSTGWHTAFLNNWALERDDGSGGFQPVNAELLSSSWVQFEVLNESTTTISFQFQTNGQILTVGAGTLDVAVGVTELPAVCVPFGEDCGEGFWCPPSGLTGDYLACRSTGPLELGASCASPTECPASSTCAVLEESPVCVALCESSDFDSPCDSGGTCQAVAADYGVCAPESAPGE